MHSVSGNYGHERLLYNTRRWYDITPTSFSTSVWSKINHKESVIPARKDRKKASEHVELLVEVT